MSHFVPLLLLVTWGINSAGGDINAKHYGKCFKMNANGNVLKCADGSKKEIVDPEPEVTTPIPDPTTNSTENSTTTAAPPPPTNTNTTGNGTCK